MGLSLGNFASELSLDDRNNAARPVQATMQQPQPSGSALRQAAATNMNTLGRLGQNAVGNNPYAAPQQQRASGWDNAQKYMGMVNAAGQQKDKPQNGLSKVLGLVGLFA